ncbi:GNAT family N-acetyltransferase [Actinoplanes sp. NPDC051411]|uniref:GNAT family N-acetyltransferase n=1 Tax=Actinoplanes sp. NPDC051411 TaxID=3155522 RepID=UPI003412295C
MSWTVRAYQPGDQRSWLRCRVLGFLDTAYYDDVLRSKPPAGGPDMVAVTGDGTVAGLITMTGATIDTVVVHPDHRRRGVGRALIDAVVPVLREGGAPTVEAWTRDDPGTLRWYRAMGFADDSHYLHVYADRYADPDEPARAGLTARPGLKPMAGFLHGTLADEEWARSRFRRVHVCRRFVRPL